MKRITLSNVESGSALVEFTLLLGVLLPLGFGMSMIGKLADLKQTTEQASRYANWEATVYSRTRLTAQHAARVETRFFKAPDSLLLSQAREVKADDSDNPLWGASTANTGNLRALANVSRDADRLVSSRFIFDTGKARASLASGKLVAKAGNPLSGFKGNSWGLVADGLLRSQIEVAIKPTGLLLGMSGSCGAQGAASGSTYKKGDQQESVCVRGSGAILADGWAAGSNAQTVSRVRSLVPASTMQRVGKGVGKLLGSVVFPELDPLDKAFGYVDTRVLPAYARPR